MAGRVCPFVVTLDDMRLLILVMISKRSFQDAHSHPRGQTTWKNGVKLLPKQKEIRTAFKKESMSLINRHVFTIRRGSYNQSTPSIVFRSNVNAFQSQASYLHNEAFLT